MHLAALPVPAGDYNGSMACATTALSLAWCCQYTCLNNSLRLLTTPRPQPLLQHAYPVSLAEGVSTQVSGLSKLLAAPGGRTCTCLKHGDVSRMLVYTWLEAQTLQGLWSAAMHGMSGSL